MNAALKLNQYLNLERITCSGLTGVINYTEPYDMRDFLLSQGIADSILFIDTAGSHTINSIINYAKQYPGDSVVIVRARRNTWVGHYLSPGVKDCMLQALLHREGQ